MPTRAERLADHFIRSAGVAAVYVDDDGAIGVVDPVTVEQGVRVLFCCPRGDHLKVAEMAFGVVPAIPGPAGALAAVRTAAAWLGVTLTPHEAVIQRAFVAVDAVSETIAKMQHSGGMKGFNRDFKAARKVNPALRYHDFLHDRKAAMLAAMAAGK